MLKETLYKFYLANPTRAILVVQFVLLIAILAITLAAQDVALAGFCDGGIGGGPNPTSIGIYH